MATRQSQSRQPESVLDGLKGIYTDIAQLQLASDAGQHAPFLQALMQGIQQYLQEMEQAKAQQAAQMAQRVSQMGAMGGRTQQPSAGMGAGMVPGGGAPGGAAQLPGAAPPGAPAQGSPGQALPNLDELSRILSGGQGAAA